MLTGFFCRTNFYSTNYFLLSTHQLTVADKCKRATNSLMHNKQEDALQTLEWCKIQNKKQMQKKMQQIPKTHKRKPKQQLQVRNTTNSLLIILIWGLVKTKSAKMFVWLYCLFIVLCWTGKFLEHTPSQGVWSHMTLWSWSTGELDQQVIWDQTPCKHR